MYWDNSEARNAIEAPWWDFRDFVLEAPADNVHPIEPTWCSSTHEKEEMTVRRDGLDGIDFKLHVEERVMLDLKASAALDLDLSDHYESF